MHLEILSPENKIFEGEVNSVIFPGSNGKFQILNNHAPLISFLKEGESLNQIPLAQLRLYLAE